MKCIEDGYITRDKKRTIMNMHKPESCDIEESSCLI